MDTAHPNQQFSIEKVEQAVKALTELSQKEGVNLLSLVEIWSFLPTQDTEDMPYLERAGECIVRISALVDEVSQDLSQNQKTARKLRLTAGLLEIKASSLE